MKSFTYGSILSVILLSAQVARAQPECSIQDSSHYRLYESSTGAFIGDGSYTNLQSCQLAAQSSRDSVLCAPGNNGRIYAVDLKNKKYEPVSFRRVEECQWASLSAASDDNLFCAILPSSSVASIADRVTGLFSREYFTMSFDEQDHLISAMENCARELQRRR